MGEPDKADGLILGIETSCDETGAAVVERGRRILSNVVASQIATHAPYGGVVPELASREHLRNIVPVVRAALSEAGVALPEIRAVAVTEGPGLAGALLVGISYAKALALALEKPLIAVNHLEGHIHAVLLEMREKGVHASPDRDGEDECWPALALVVSGGHTHLYLAEKHGEDLTYRNVGRTVDDAAGEAFDKVAKLLGFGYPGGPWIDFLAAHGDSRAVPFALPQVKSKPYRNAGKTQGFEGFLFSFSGLKTAVLRFVETHNMRAAIEHRRKALESLPHPSPADALTLCDEQTLGLIASFQHVVVGDLLRKSFRAVEALGARCLLVSGGVAANRELRARFSAEAETKGISVDFPSLSLATDNAAMIAAAAWPKLLASRFAPPELSAQPGLALGANHSVMSAL